mgnify:FL=1
MRRLRILGVVAVLFTTQKRRYGEYLYQPLYCSTNSEANYEKIMYALDEEFELFGLDGRDNWMRGEFDSKWECPIETLRRLLASLAPDGTLYFEVVSFEPGMGYLVAYLYCGGLWEEF